jgi:CDP-glucose 4,6-dehydratase
MESMAGLRKKSILITGGAGFIGSHLAQELSTRYKVVVVDIRVDPKSYFKKEKLNKIAELVFCDITNKEKTEKTILKYRPEFIFHLAADPIVAESYREPYQTFQNNIMGAVNVLEASRKLKKLKGVIVASSDKAYGKTKKAYTEDSPLKADHPYDVSKAAADLIALSYNKTYGLPVAVTRFGNVYGEGDFHFGRIVPDICEAVIKNKTLMLRSDGTYIRDYLYVKDVVDGYIFLMNNFKKANGQAFNFSSKDNLSVIQLIKKTEKVLGKKVKYKILNNAVNEIPYQHLNDARIRRLGWKNTSTFSSRIVQIYSWYKIILT